MDHFERGEDGRIRAEGVELADIAAAVGTPTYVYSRATFERHFRVFDEAWDGVDHLICYAVKASSNLAILALLARLGAGFDIVSGGELYRVLKAGGDPSKIVFSGVGKTSGEMAAALDAGILCFNVESGAELHQLNAVALAKGVVAPISIRVNPDVDPKTHPYISTGLKRNKFGIPFDEAIAGYRLAASLPGLKIIGLDCHIGSQLAETGPLLEAMSRMLELVDTLTAEGIHLSHLDVGGGLGITYNQEAPPTPAAYASELKALFVGRELTIICEPGRVIAGNAGVLLTRCLLRKRNSDALFVVVDAGMNDAIRPALYGAWHTIVPVDAPRALTEEVDIVGPICESGDFLAKERTMPRIEAGELLVMRSAGAYGFSMSSNYNSRGRAAEVMVDGDGFSVVRTRESWEDLIRGEHIPSAFVEG